MLVKSSIGQFLSLGDLLLLIFTGSSLLCMFAGFALMVGAFNHRRSDALQTIIELSRKLPIKLTDSAHLTERGLQLRSRSIWFMLAFIILMVLANLVILVFGVPA